MDIRIAARPLNVQTLQGDVVGPVKDRPQSVSVHMSGST